MAKKAHRDLSTLGWIGLRDAELRQLGHDPRQRLAMTGHRRPLPEHWLDSIGCWGLLDSSQMVDGSAPHKALVHVTPEAYRKFKSRYRLKTRRQFVTAHGPHDWTLAELSFSEHNRAQQTFIDACGCCAPIGVACEYAIVTAGPTWRPKALGLLPVELVLWTRVFQDLLDRHGLDEATWRELDIAARAQLWSAGRDGAPWSARTLLDWPAQSVATPDLTFERPRPQSRRRPASA